MKTIKQIREEYDNKFVGKFSDEVLLEKSMMGPNAEIPSPKVMPTILVFRRLSYRAYPQNQVVALYYSKMVNKYLSVPFGPTGNLNMSESTIYDTLEELELAEGAKWEATKGAVKGAVHGVIRGGFMGAAFGALPGAAIGATIGGVRGAYKGAKRGLEKTATESFKDRYAAIKEEGALDKAKYLASKEYDNITRDNAGVDHDLGAKEYIPGYVDQKKASGNWKRGNYGQALKYGARSFGKKMMAGAAVAGAGLAALSGAGTAAKMAAGASLAGGGGSGDGEMRGQSKSASTNLKRSNTVKTSSSWDKGKKKDVAENTIQDIKAMLESGGTLHEMKINGKQIQLNNTMAKRILEVYDSVNSKNKKIVESMLNEDLETFKKLLNFSIRKQ